MKDPLYVMGMIVLLMEMGVVGFLIFAIWDTERRR